ncbi:MAG: glutaminyl-peptide cyclotransferase [Pseudomonadota bacterium]
MEFIAARLRGRYRLALLSGKLRLARLPVVPAAFMSFGPHKTLLTLAAVFAVFASTVSTQAQAAIKRYRFEELERIAQPRENFVQGLQIVGDRLYMGTGLYGSSRLLEYEFPSMELRREVDLPDELFGEGVTRLGNRIYQLTYRARKLLVYDADTLENVGSAPISTEGWGITFTPAGLVYSDGTHRLFFLDPDSLRVVRTIEVTLNRQPLPRLNELEWINGRIWANVWRSNQLVEINPETGAVEAIADLRGLLDPKLREEDTDVLNGIAWDSDAKQLWVTGKRWPFLYRVRLVDFDTPSPLRPGTQTPTRSP